MLTIGSLVVKTFWRAKNSSPATSPHRPAPPASPIPTAANALQVRAGPSGQYPPEHHARLSSVGSSRKIWLACMRGKHNFTWMPHVTVDHMQSLIPGASYQQHTAPSASPRLSLSTHQPTSGFGSTPRLPPGNVSNPYGFICQPITKSRCDLQST